MNNTGKVITILERKEAQPGADVYLTIDKDLTEAVYNIIEQKGWPGLVGKQDHQRQRIQSAGECQELVH